MFFRPGESSNQNVGAPVDEQRQQIFLETLSSLRSEYEADGGVKVSKIEEAMIQKLEHSPIKAYSRTHIISLLRDDEEITVHGGFALFQASPDIILRDHINQLALMV